MTSIPRKQTWPAHLDAAQIKRVQQVLNAFFKETGLKGYPPLRVDGVNGQLTRKRIVVAKWFLGYLGKRDARVSRRLIGQLLHPNWRILSNPFRVKRGQQRRRHHNEVYDRNHQNLPGHVGHYDGIPVAAYFIPILQWCREHGWHGHLVSGYRTPEYSEHLCQVMCGAPTCAGRCAGRHTNHAGLDFRKTPCGAIDVSDYWTFASVVARCPLLPKLHNYLPNDRVHFSPTGN